MAHRYPPQLPSHRPVVDPASNFSPVLNSNAFGNDSDSDLSVRHTHHDDDDGTDEEAAPVFDAYKDFNNAGPRYVTLLSNAAYHPDPLKDSDKDPVRSSPRHPAQTLSEDTPPFYSSDSTPSYHPRDPQKVPPACGRPSRSCKSKRPTWRVGVVLVFILLACLGVAIYFVMPRQPFISYETPISFTGNSDSVNFTSANPTQFAFDAQLSLSLDGRNSYVPVRLSNVNIVVKDLASSSADSVRVGKGSLRKSLTVRTRSLTPLTADIRFQYSASQQTDAVYQAWRKACENINQSKVDGNVARPSLTLSILITFNMLGAVGSLADASQQAGVSCPVELPASFV